MAEIRFTPISTWAPDFVAAIRRHYTGSRGAPPGKKMAWRIEHGLATLGWIGLGEPAFKLAPRRRLNLEDARPLPGTVCCFIYRIEQPGISAGEVLKLWHPVAAAAWLERYSWAPIHWESMVGSGGGSRGESRSLLQARGVQKPGDDHRQDSQEAAGAHARTQGLDGWGAQVGALQRPTCQATEGRGC